MRIIVRSALLLPLLALAATVLYAQSPAYVLPPEKLAKAIDLNRAETILSVTSFAWSLLALLWMLRLGIMSTLSQYAERLTPKKWLQGFFFLPTLLLLITLLDLPLALAGHHISLALGLSIQHWLSWFTDWAKALGLTLLAGTFVLSILFAIIRRSPRLWWFWCWLLAIPLILASVYLVPVVIDPLFNHYEPLQQSNPALVAQLTKVVQKSGIMIPPSRMFLMKASEKVTTANAYVTGFGASKRVVVWDTTIHSSSPDGILFIFGHELGHYALGHIVTGTVLSIAGTLVFLFFSYYLAHWLIEKRAAQWGIHGFADWSTVAVLLLTAQILGFLASPIQNDISRSFEHHADIYGEEVIHGIVADPQHTAQQSFQQLGEESLDLPDPNRLIVFWSYSHPTILERATFALAYNPWAHGGTPRYIK